MIMFPNVQVRHIFFLSSIFIAHGIVHEYTWITHLVEYIKNDLKISQAVFIIDDNLDNETSKIESILRKMQTNIPNQVISLKNATLSRAGMRKFPQGLQSTTLFIGLLFVRDNLENSSFSESTQFLIKLSAYQPRPKCLMIVFPRKEGLTFKESLQKMWSKNFLDITILEVIGKRSGNNYFPWSRSGSITKVYHLNPFTGIYARENYGEKIKLFPNTLRDLNGFQMKVGSFNYPPYVKVKRNSTGHPLLISGPEASIVKALSRAMNFRILQVPAQEEWWGRMLCENTSMASGFLRQLRDNEIHFLTNQGIRRYNCTIEYSRSTGLVQYNALILKSKEKKRSLSLSMKWLYLVLLIVPIWLMTRVLKFDTYYWSLIGIIQALLGISVPREPQRPAERVIFATVLIAFSVFSSTLFAILTDVKITEDPDVVIDTLEDLNKSNLIPIMPEMFYRLLKIESDHITETLLNKSRINIGREECRNMLLHHEKVACIDREITSELFIQSHLDEDGRPGMKLVKQTFGHYVKTILFERNSPFVRAIDKILIKILESGLEIHWREALSSRLIKSSLSEEEESVYLIFPLLIVLATGYGLSLLVFLSELLKKNIEKVALNYIRFILPGNGF